MERKKSRSSALPGAPSAGIPVKMSLTPEEPDSAVLGNEPLLPGAAAPLSARSEAEPQFLFAGFRLQADGTLFRGAKPVHLPPKELAALQYLLAHAGQIVTPLQLKQALWGDVHVTAESIPKCLSSLRARLEPEDCIQTVYKRGYRFTAEVRPGGAEPSGALPRLAITPFTTLYGVPEHLGMGVAEETITRLTAAHNPAVSVLARDSVFTLARRGYTAQQIGEALKADLVLAGTLRALPSHFRLRAEMIRVHDGIQIWVEDLLVDRSRFAGLEAKLVNLLAFRLNAPAAINRDTQEAVKGSGGSGNLAPRTTAPHAAGARFAEFVSSQGRKAGNLSISAAAEPFVERRRSPGRREAYEYYQRGHYEWQTLQRHRMQDGLLHLTRAIELDPSLLPAKVDLVHLCVAQEFYGYMSPAVAAELVRRTWESIPEHPPGSEAILPAMGWVNFHVDHNLPAALWAFSLSAHLPHDPWITRLRAMFALSRHRFDEAIGLLRATLQQDPFSLSLRARLAWALHLAGQAGESVECILHALALSPEDDDTHLYGSMILSFNGDSKRGTELAQNLSQRLPHFDLASAVHAYALACAGRGDEARTIIERLQWLSRERYVISSFTAAAHVALGNHDAALSELRNAADTHCPWFFQMLADPRLKPLQARPEFVEMRSILAHMEAAAAEDPETAD